MDYNTIRIPFLSNDDIKSKAGLFRKKFWSNVIPVDIEKIAEFKLKIRIIPLPNLQQYCNVDAFIASNMKSIYIDNDSYFDERNQNRFRFSLAHEVGHFVLHKDLYSVFNIKNFVDFNKFLKVAPQEQYKYLEVQANKFASHLLVPRGKLAIEKQELFKAVRFQNQKIDLHSFDKVILNSYIASILAGTFGVSNKVVEIALNDL